MNLKRPTELIWDDRLPPADKEAVAKLNASVERLDALRAIEINVSGHFAQSKIAWKFATYQHALLHRIVALMDGAAVAWNNRCTLSAILSARALMETIAAMSHFERAVVVLLKYQDLGGLNDYATRGTFASRDPEWLKDYPDTKAINAQTYVDKFDRFAPGFKQHYDFLSERAHPNSLGHNFMFSALDTADGSTSYSDERSPEGNAKMILAALFPLPLVESMMDRLDALIVQVAEVHHRLAPVGGPNSIEDKPTDRKAPEVVAAERRKLVSLYTAIGQFMFEFSQLEFVIRHALGQALDLNDEGSDAQFDIVTSPYDFASLCNVTKAIFVRTMKCGESDKHEIESILNECMALNSAERLPIAHGTWFIDETRLGARHVPRNKLEMTYRYPKISDIDAAAQKAATLRVRLLKFIGVPIPSKPGPETENM